MDLTSERIKALELSPTFAMAQKSRDLKAQGIDIINLSIGEPDFDTPQHIKDAAIQAIKDNYSHYTPVAGYEELQKAIVNKLKRENNLEYTTKQVVVSTGAKQSLFNALQCIVNVGDEVVIPSPYWVSYVELVKLAGGKPVIVNTGMENDFKITPEQLENAINIKTKAVFINSPSNPSGSIYSKSELEDIAKIIQKFPHCMIISDEIYEHINYTSNHESIAQFPFIKEQVILINGVSKGYAMTGWRIGYMASADWLAKAANKLQGQVTSGATSIAQMAAIAALNGSLDTTIEMRDRFMERRDMAVKLLKEINGFEIEIPKAAFYLFPRINKLFGKRYQNHVIDNANDLAMFLLEYAQVAVVTGQAFGANDYIRLSYALSNDKLQEAISRIKSAVNLLE